MTSVLGLGNVLMGDDGFGPSVVEAFQGEYEIGANVEVVDLGTPGLDVLPWLADVARVIIVDTVRSERPPGTLLLYSKQDLLTRASAIRLSPHDPGVLETIVTLEFAGRAPREVMLIGVVPGRLRLGLGLSDAVQRAIVPAVAAIASALEKAGHRVPRRTSPARDDAWWLAAASLPSAAE